MKILENKKIIKKFYEILAYRRIRPVLFYDTKINGIQLQLVLALLQ
jgi:hypothetical protein